MDMLIVLFTFLFVEMFDTVGTLIGVTTKAGLVDEGGKIPNVKAALLACIVSFTSVYTGSQCGNDPGTGTGGVVHGVTD